MLRDSIDRKFCDSRLLVALFATTGLLSSLACSNSDAVPEGDDAETDVQAAEPGTPGGPTPNGLTLPAVQDWLPIGAVARQDNGGEVRVIVGNPTAVTAARAGQTNPWPEGTMLSHFVWAADSNEADPSGATINPGAFKAITLMVKNTAMYADDGGWAYGAWMGADLTPPAMEGFDRACVNCHTERVADKDYVFTVPGQLPDPATLAAAPDALNGVGFPSRVLDWRVIGIADILNPMNPTLRVLVGNPTAVDAARAGETNPWPDGSMISHLQWSAGTNEDTGDFVTPGAFAAVTLMQRSSARYEVDGDWAYGVWRGMALEPLADPAFDRGCVSCHTMNVSDRDMVFNNVGQLPAALLARAASSVSR